MAVNLLNNTWYESVKYDSYKSGNTIYFSGSGNGANDKLWTDYIYISLNLSNYRTINLTWTGKVSWGIANITFAIFDSSFSAVKSEAISKSSGSASLDCSSLSGNYYVGFSCYLNAYYDGEHNPGAYFTMSVLNAIESNYTVTLNTSAGISEVSPAASNSVVPGGSLNIDATVSSGYKWNTWTGDTGYLTSAATTKANTVTPSANITLTATATGNTYYVKYNKNDSAATGTMANSTHIYGTAKTLTANAFKKTGYSFSGWATSANGNVAYADKASVSGLTTTSGATVNLYAKWKANTYTVVYNANGGVGTMSNVTHTYDSAKALTKNAFTRAGYIFIGWATSSSGNVKYKDGESVKNLVTSGTVNLYAVWVREGTVRIMVGGVYKIA